MAIDRKMFYEISKPLFKKYSQSQIDGINTILDTYENEFSEIGIKQLAYILATAYHETARTMQPIAEYGKGKGRKYGIPNAKGLTYYGRGFVQLTWDYNYKKAGEKIGVDLLNNPDLAMNLNNATKIMFEGMIEGWFTGRKLDNYFTDKVTQPQNARRIINGTDKAILIAGYYQVFFNALK